MKPYIIEAQRLKAAGLTTRQIGRQLFPDVPENTARERVKKALQAHRMPQGEPPRLRGIECRADGSTTFEGIVELLEGQDITPKAIMAAHNLDPLAWDVVSYKSNFWQSQKKGGKTIVLYQSKITVKPRKGGIRFEEIDRYFAEKDFSRLPSIKPAHFDPDGEVLEVCIPDLHSGLFSWRLETGEDYDHEIVRERFTGCMADILARCEGKRFSKILFVTLGDLLHVDTASDTTTKGTPQQTDGRFSKFFENTLDLMIDAICAFEQIAPVEVVYIAGNHDTITGYTLVKAVEMAFTQHAFVTFDVWPNPRKWRRIGKNLIGWCHGDIPNKHRTTWLHQDAREDYGQTEYAEVHAGHIHSQSTVEENGLVYRNLPTICGASAWEHKQAFGRSHRCIMSFVWAPDEAGPRDIWFSNIQERRSETA